MEISRSEYTTVYIYTCLEITLFWMPELVSFDNDKSLFLPSLVFID